MKIQWFGQACFCITSQTGLKLITDPYQTGLSPRFLYAPVNSSADIVTVSHGHSDHDNVSAVSGNPAVVRSPGIANVKGLEIKGVMTHHDKVKGAELGANIIFTFEMDGIRLTHLGDLGHPLSLDQIAELQGTDILFIPAGGGNPQDFQDVIHLWRQLKPRIVIPMHFSTVHCLSQKYKAEDLLRLVPGAKIIGGSQISITIETLPASTQMFILDPLR
jgi:L-ascorbate metabolism protein UlaG (beta-lactamase superfamily)